MKRTSLPAVLRVSLTPALQHMAQRTTQQVGLHEPTQTRSRLQLPPVRRCCMHAASACEGVRTASRCHEPRTRCAELVLCCAARTGGGGGCAGVGPVLGMLRPPECACSRAGAAAVAAVAPVWRKRSVLDPYCGRNAGMERGLFWIQVRLLGPATAVACRRRPVPSHLRRRPVPSHPIWRRLCNTPRHCTAVCLVCVYA